MSPSLANEKILLADLDPSIVKSELISKTNLRALSNLNHQWAASIKPIVMLQDDHQIFAAKYKVNAKSDLNSWLQIGGYN